MKNKVKYKNIMCAAKISFPKGFKRSQSQHYRLFSSNSDPVKRYYHCEVLNEQNIYKRMLTDSEKKEIYKRAVIVGRRKGK